MCPECGNNLRAALGPVDPGSRPRARMAMWLALVLIGVIACIQQFGGSVLSSSPTTGPAAGPGIAPPDAQFEITAKIFTRFQKAFGDKKLGESAVKSLDGQASEAADEFRTALLAGELGTVEEARRRLGSIEEKLPGDAALREDIAAVRTLYDGVAAGAEDQARLRARHGYFADLVLTRDLPDTDPARQRLVGGGMALFILIIGVCAAIGLAFIAGTALLVVAIVGVTSGRLRPAFIPPTPGGSVAIEIVAVFAFGFLILKGVSALAEMYLSAREALWLGLVAQWALLAVVLWPRFVGATGGMALLGWHKGRGVWTEIGCGFLGYLACVPVFLVGAAVSLVLTLIESAIRQAIFGTPPAPPHNPVLDIVSGKAGVLVIVVVYLLATLWAPIVEETVFRGGMYRHLRSRWRVVPAAAFTAVCFGVMHAYPVLMMGPVMALGFGFAMIREWRGSLIASMTAHAIHNAAVLGLLLVAMKLMG